MKVLRSSSETSNWSDNFEKLGAEAKKGEEKRGQADRGTGWRPDRPRDSGCGMKLLPTWRAVLPVGPQGTAWPWAQQPRSRWALGGWGWGSTRGVEPGATSLPHQLRSLSPLDPPQVPSTNSRPYGQAGLDGPRGRNRLGSGTGFRGCVTDIWSHRAQCLERHCTQFNALLLLI